MNRIKTLALFLWISLLTTSNAAFGQGHEDVFPEKSGSELLNLLRGEYKPAAVLDYYNARLKMYTEIYNENDTVFGIYTRYGLPLSPNDPDPIGTLIRNNSPYGINTEHTFPQSKGARDGNARSDMHHLFPAMARVNSARSNFPYGEIQDSRTQWWYYKDKAIRSIPTEHIDNYSESIDGVFEPREAVKGDVARAMFYFMTIYRSQADARFFSGQRKILCQWAIDDPVDSVEWARNGLIAQYQSGKKNPYIQDCTLATRTFCPEFTNNCLVSSTDLYLSKVIAEILPNPSHRPCTLHIEAPDPVSIQVTAYDHKGHVTGQAQSNGFVKHLNETLALNGKGLHIVVIRLHTPEGQQHTLVRKIERR